MFLIHYDSFTLTTAQSVEEIQKRLADAIEPHKTLPSTLKGDHKPYQGALEDDKFTISRIIHYRNNFLPIIKGEMQQNGVESTVKVTMHPNIWTLAATLFVLLWLVTYSAPPALKVINTFFQTGQPPENFWLTMLPLGIGVLGYSFTLFVYRREARIAKQFLHQLVSE